MNAEAISLMIFSMVALWGGLGVAVWNLNRHEKHRAAEFRRDL